jgi:hypothetical protein
LKVNSVEEKVDVALESAPMIWAPGIIRYAINGYRAGGKKDKAKMVNIVMCWNHPMMTEDIATGILTGRIPVTFDETEGKVRFTL